ncbi:poly(A) polymerase 3 [Actinidia rufa]|uniref:Poly(A) polymerase 3 n=1 Tax=Actinidia rufa TaxID=165716 RepID=A0A7J0GSS3_9ERIC|nr:poly(A) polymerase 3 [Actinidia rufa]
MEEDFFSLRATELKCGRYESLIRIVDQNMANQVYNSESDAYMYWSSLWKPAYTLYINPLGVLTQPLIPERH